MNRELLRAVAGSQLLQGALSAALPVGLAIGFAEVLARVPEAIQKMTDALAGFNEASKKSITDAIDSNDKLFTQFQTIEDGYTKINEIRNRSASSGLAQDAFSNPFQGVREAVGAGGINQGLVQLLSNYQLYNNFKKDNQHWDTLEIQADEQLNKLIIDRNKENERAAEKATEQAQQARNAWVAAIDAASKASTGLTSKDQSPADKQLAAISEQLAAWYKISQAQTGINEIANKFTGELQKQAGLIKAQEEASIRISLLTAGHKSFSDTVTAPNAGVLFSGSNAALNLSNIQNNQSDAIKAAQEIYDQTATAAEKYGETMAVLNTLLNQGRISQLQFSAAALKAGADLNASPFKKYYEELGRDIGKTIGQAILFQESWQKAFRALLDDVVKLVLQMYVFKSLATAFGGAGGGFLGALFTGLAGGRAGGGDVSGGMSYLVGERGPEIFTPGASGAITPHSSLGGSSTIYNIDARGADAGVEQRVRQAIAASENRAVSRSMAAAADQRARR